MSDFETATYLIYGLIDPKTRLIRYVGKSSSGMKRPRDHGKRSCPDTYCRRWVRSLERIGLTYEIVVLEILPDHTDLAAAERWWIAYGRGCGWPLTNLTDGNGPAEDAMNEIRFGEILQENEEIRQAERDGLIRLAKLDNERKHAKDYFAFFDEHRNQPDYWLKVKLMERAKISYVSASNYLYGWENFKTPDSMFRNAIDEIEKQCLNFFEDHIVPKHRERKMINKLIITKKVTRDTAEGAYAKWRSQNPDRKPPEEERKIIRLRCYELFSQGKSVPEVSSELGVDRDVVSFYNTLWFKAAYKRGKEALERDRQTLIVRMQEAKAKRGK